MAENPSKELMTSRSQGSARGFLGRVRTTLEMIKFEHSIFALPFALTGAMLAARGWPTGRQLFWLIVAMVGARSAAMAFNRVADMKIDAANPRTRMRALPAGHLSLSFVAGFIVVSAALLGLAAFELNPLAFKLSPVALAILLLYSYTKRFTWLSHLVLGLCLGMAPVAAWIALRGDIDAGVLVLGVAVALWVAGFDIIYSLQDVEFDRTAGLHSLPRHFGISASLYASAGLHVVMLGLLVLTARLEHLGWLAGAGLVAVAGLLAYEHLLVKPNDLSRVNAAFFNINGYISLLFFVTWAADILRLSH
jgi:4-hydroxybenzoate polyprenyltransferase